MTAAATMLTTDAADLADLLTCLRDWVDAEEEHLDPLLDKHGYDLIGLRVSLNRFAALLTDTHTGTDDSELPF